MARCRQTDPQPRHCHYQGASPAQQQPALSEAAGSSEQNQHGAGVDAVSASYRGMPITKSSNQSSSSQPCAKDVPKPGVGLDVNTQVGPGVRSCRRLSNKLYPLP